MAETDSDGGAAIVVTAQRRAERIQDVPIFVTPVSSDRLDQVEATETAELDKIVSSLVMTRTGPFTQPYIRGIGKRSTLGVENSVATYVDGVYLGSAISALQDLRGIERVEVLNGPQGTLFGRNATAGVIQIVTREPTPGASGEAILSAGSHDFVRGDIYASAGSEKLAGNIAAGVWHRGGFGRNFFTGGNEQDRVSHSVAVRSKWLLKASDAVKLTLAGDYQGIDHDFASQPVPGFPPAGRPRKQGFRHGDQDHSNRFRFRYGGVSLKAEAEVSSVALSSITAWRRMDADYGLDLDLGPQPFISFSPTAEQEQFSQEFQAQSNEKSRLRWVAGLYYINLAERFDPTIIDSGGLYSTFLGGRTRQTLVDEGEVSSAAAYGQAVLALGADTELTAGLRYTVEERKVTARGERLFVTAPLVRPIPGVPLLDQPPLRDSETFRKLTWRAALSHDFSDVLMGYVSASRGFQSGGWNLQTPQNAPFAPETLDDFETGLKFADRAGRASADATLFYYDYSDVQVSSITQLGLATTNAAAARVYGLDLQFMMRPMRASEILVGAQILNARYKSFANAGCSDYSNKGPAPYPAVACDASGNRLPFAPKLRLNVGANHAVALGRMGRATLSGNLSYNSGYFAEPDNVVRARAFAVADLTAEWQPRWKGPSFRLWALNLTNSRTFNSIATVPGVAVHQNPGPPRRVGASVAYSF